MLTKDDIFQFEHWFSAMTVVKKKLGRLIDRRGRVSRFVVNYSDLVAGTSVKIGSTEWDTIPAGATIRRVYYRNVVAMAGDGNSASTHRGWSQHVQRCACGDRVQQRRSYGYDGHEGCDSGRYGRDSPCSGRRLPPGCHADDRWHGHEADRWSDLRLRCLGSDSGGFRLSAGGLRPPLPFFFEERMIGGNKSALILAGKNEYKKQHYEYLSDGTQRLLKLYETQLDTADGKPCIVTQFAYVGSTTQLAGTIEYEGSWQSAWDIIPA
jgi:hypothetical protein